MPCACAACFHYLTVSAELIEYFEVVALNIAVEDHTATLGGAIEACVVHAPCHTHAEVLIGFVLNVSHERSSVDRSTCDSAVVVELHLAYIYMLTCGHAFNTEADIFDNIA